VKTGLENRENPAPAPAPRVAESFVPIPFQEVAMAETENTAPQAPGVMPTSSAPAPPGRSSLAGAHSAPMR
jgi:hypothetical protein